MDGAPQNVVEHEAPARHLGHSRWRVRAPWLLLAAYVVATFPLLFVGLADNGDYQRAMSNLSTGPVGFEPGIPTHPATWEARYFNHYLPAWNGRFAVGRPRSSALLLWAPGYALGRAISPAGTFLLPVLSIVPRVVVALLLVVFVGLLARDRSLGTVAVWVGGGLAFLCAATADYQAYLNSLFNEVAAIVFLLAFLICLLARDSAQRQPILSTLGLVALAGLTCARPAQSLWAIPGAMLLSPYTARRELGPARLAALGAASAALFAFALWFTVWPQDVPYNAHNRIFDGLLMESRDPVAHLEALDLAPFAGFVGHSAHDPERGVVHTQDRVAFADAVTIALREPAAALRLYLTACRAMQDISLDYLGKRPPSDRVGRPAAPRRVSWERRTEQPGMAERRLDLDFPPFLRAWTIAKYHAFPRGATLLFAVPLMVALLAWAGRRDPTSARHAIVGAVCIVGCLAEVGVAVFGDGRWELIKHLVVANVLFDAGLVLTVVVLCRRLRQHPAAPA